MGISKKVYCIRLCSFIWMPELVSHNWMCNNHVGTFQSREKV